MSPASPALAGRFFTAEPPGRPLRNRSPCDQGNHPEHGRGSAYGERNASLLLKQAGTCCGQGSAPEQKHRVDLGRGRRVVCSLHTRQDAGSGHGPREPAPLSILQATHRGPNTGFADLAGAPWAGPRGMSAQPCRPGSQ